MLYFYRYCIIISAVFTCIGALGTPPAELGPSLESIYRVSLAVDLFRRFRQKINSIFCTVICNYRSAAQEQPFTVGLFCITEAQCTRSLGFGYKL